MPSRSDQKSNLARQNRPWKDTDMFALEGRDWFNYWDQHAQYYGHPVDLMFCSAGTGYISYIDPETGNVKQVMVDVKDRLAAAKTLLHLRFPALKAVEMDITQQVEHRHLHALSALGPDVIKAAAVALRDHREEVKAKSEANKQKAKVYELDLADVGISE